MRLGPSLSRWLVRAGSGALALTLFAWGAGEYAARRAASELQVQANVAAALHAAVLRSELEKHRSLPFVLAQDPDVLTVLNSGRRAPTIALDRKLEGLSLGTRAADIYILDDRGLTIASSNWRLPTSFVGSNYGFRPYFHDALRLGVAEYFALGTVSRRPGLYLARRVDAGAVPLGVVVVKVEFDRLESEWRQSGEPAYVTDPNGVVLVTSIPGWRFRTQRPLGLVRRRQLREGLQFGGASLAPLPLRGAEPYGQVVVRTPGEKAQRFFAGEAAITTPAWSVRLLLASDPVLGTAITAARAEALIAGGLVLLGLGLLIRRREVEAARTVARDAARVDLEQRVRARTAELRAANEQLTVEIDERRRAEASLHTLQDELVQANKLAMLGQIAAGVAHEINQPVAAIRTYADNAAVFLNRAELQPARKNLAVIATLTEKIGVITQELRAFSRKTTGQPSPVPVGEAVTGALLLVGPTIRRKRVKLIREGDVRGLNVLAEPIRLEQVLVNLLQNALDAVAESPAPLVRLSVGTEASQVRITVADNGSGLSAEARGGLFTPFLSKKPNGLGLGLVISRDILREFEGWLEVETAPEGGAAFVVVLRLAP